MPEPQGPTQPGRRRVLLIEDNPTNSKLCRLTLVAAGHDVVVAADAETGLALARREHPDVVLMDIQLPGMNGLDATRAIRADPTLSSVPVIALTAHALESDRTQALAAGCVGYITKPIDTATFADQIVQLIARAGGEPKSHVTTSEGRVLVVDDEPANVRLVKMKLATEPFDVITATGGQEAIDKALAEQPDVILLDVMMPGLDGFEVTRRLKSAAATRDIPIVLLTALDGVDHKARGFAAGADDFLSKPVNTHELVARLHSMVRLRRVRDQLELRAGPSAPIDASPAETRGRVLLVEDSMRDARLTRQLLELEGHDVTVCGSASEARGALDAASWDLVVLDLMLPDGDGRELAAELTRMPSTARGSRPQVLVSTALGDLETRIASLSLGVDDFLAKPVHARELELRVRSLVAKKRDIDRLLARAEVTGQRDPATGLPTRDYLVPFVTAELVRARKLRYPLTLVMLEVECDGTRGDCDQRAAELAQALAESIACTDVAVRWDTRRIALVLPYHGTREAEATLSLVRRNIVTDALEEVVSALTIAALVVPVGDWNAWRLVDLVERESVRLSGLGDRTSIVTPMPDLELAP